MAVRKERKEVIDIEKLETKHGEESVEIFKQEKGNTKERQSRKNLKKSQCRLTHKSVIPSNTSPGTESQYSTPHLSSGLRHATNIAT